MYRRPTDNPQDDRESLPDPFQSDRDRASRVEEVYFAPFDVARQNAKQATGYWWLYVLLGLLTMALGAFALASQINAVSTLVALVVVLLFCAGAVELLLGVLRRPASWLAIVAGAASIAFGVVAVAWPEVTLYVLALFVGISLLAWGIYDIYRSFTADVVRPRAAGLMAGIALVALGVLVLARPSISAVVLGIIVAILLIVQGLFSFVAGLRLLDLHRALGHKPVEARAQRREDRADQAR